MRWTGGAPGVTDTNFTLGNSFARQSAAAAATTGATNIQPALAFVITNGAAIDFTIRVGASQVETGAFPTSYIPTTGAAATRADDIAIVATAGWYNQLAGSAVSEFSQNGVRPASFPRAVQFDDGTNNNNIAQLLSSASGALYSASLVGGSTVWSMGSSGTYLANVVRRMGSAWTAGSQRFDLDGMQPQSASGASLPTGITTLRLGRDTGNILQSAYLRRVRYWSSMLSADQLARETTIGPSLELVFTDTSTLDPSITFTRASTASYFNSSGVLSSAAINAPRFGYDPITLASRGLLIEEARTNQCWPSIPGASWTTTNGTTTPAAAVAPDGTTAATLFVDNAVSSQHQTVTNVNFAYSATTAYTFSVYAKQGTAWGLQIFAGSAPFDLTTYANFNLATGTVGTVSGVGSSASMQSVGNGWYRCIFTATTTAAASTVAMALCLTNNNNAASRGAVYVGTGTGVYIWGAQTEAGAFQTSYIPTTSAAATRAVDIASMPAGPWFNAAASTLSAEFMIAYPPSATNFNCITEIDDGATNNAMIVRVQTLSGLANAAILVGGASVGTATTANGYIQNAIMKSAGAFTTTAVSACLNGGAVASAASTAIPTVNRLLIGSGRLNPLNGFVRRVRYWPRPLSNTELQQVTT